MSVKNYIDRVLNKFAGQITDRVFLMIQSDKELMQKYLDLVASGTNSDTLNRELGKQVKAKFNLQNAGRCNKPDSTLITSYERHKIR